MSEREMKRLIEMAATDENFRRELAINPEEAIQREGLNLDFEEMEAIKKIGEEGEEAFSRGLDERLSKSGFILSQVDYLRDSGEKVGLYEPGEEEEGMSGEEEDLEEEIPEDKSDKDKIAYTDEEEELGEELDEKEGG